MRCASVPFRPLAFHHCWFLPRTSGGDRGDNQRYRMGNRRDDTEIRSPTSAGFITIIVRWTIWPNLSLTNTIDARADGRGEITIPVGGEIIRTSAARTNMDGRPTGATHAPT